jgi:uncharacterized membrane protein
MSTNAIIILDCIITALIALCFYYRCENYSHTTRRENEERREREKRTLRRGSQKPALE